MAVKVARDEAGPPEDPRRRQSRHDPQDARSGVARRRSRKRTRASCLSRSTSTGWPMPRRRSSPGADMIAHSVRDVPVDDEFISALKARDVCYSPTLTRELSTFIYDSTPPWVDDPFFLKGAEKGVRRAAQGSEAPGASFATARRGKRDSNTRAGLEVAKQNLKTLVDRGVRIAFGTDTGPPGRFQGFFEHLELEMMVEAGLTPMQAIVSATGDAARCHRKAGRVRHAGVGRRGRSVDPECQPAREHPQHAEHRRRSGSTERRLTTGGPKSAPTSSAWRTRPTRAPDRPRSRRRSPCGSCSCREA